MKVVVISGKARHGKDTLSGFMKEFLEEQDKKVLITHYGDLVKYVCKTFFDWDGQKDEKGRTLLQKVGTDWVRNKPGWENYWVDFICDILSLFPNEWDYVLIPDCRFPNEIEVVKEHFDNVAHVRIIRENFVSPLTEEQQKHPSETALDGYEADVTVYNDSTLDNLRIAAQRIALLMDAMKFGEEDDSNG